MTSLAQLPFVLLVWRLLRRLVGHRHDTRFNWGEASPHFRWPKIGLLYSPSGSCEKNMLIIHAVFISFYLYLPTWRFGNGMMTGDEPDYGFYTIDNQIVFRWGPMRDRRDVEAGKGLKGYWSFSWPWFSYNWVSNEILSIDGQRSVWMSKPGHDHDYNVQEAIIAANCQTYPYAYRLKNGELQQRNATIHVTRWTHSRKWFPFVKRVNTGIHVKFDGEVGERSGSWKGGCTGCSVSMRADESPLDALRRMERERIFN